MCLRNFALALLCFTLLATAPAHADPKAEMPFREVPRPGPLHDESKPRDAETKLHGIESVWISVRQGPDLLGWNPWPFCRGNPEFVPMMVSLREQLPFLWGYPGAFSVELEARPNPGGVIASRRCTVPGSVAYHDSHSLSLPLRINGLDWDVAYESKFGDWHEIHGEPTVSDFTRKFRIDGKRVKRRGVEGIVKFTMHHERKATLTITSGAKKLPVWNRSWDDSGKCDGRVILKICPSADRYYVQLDYDGHKVGPGWQRAPNNEESGGADIWAQLTSVNEEFLYRYEKEGRGHSWPDGPYCPVDHFLGSTVTLIEGSITGMGTILSHFIGRGPGPDDNAGARRAEQPKPLTGKEFIASRLERAKDRPGEPVVGANLGERWSSSSSPITDADLVHLQPFEQLEQIDLQLTGVTDAGLIQLKKFKALRELNLSFTKVTDAGLGELKDFKNLQTLSLDWSNVTDAGLHHLQGLPALRHLTLGGNITDNGLRALRDLPRLQSLTLSGNEKLTDKGLRHLKNLNGLETLNLSRYPITDAGAAHLAGLTGLRHLNLSGTSVTDKGLKHLRALTKLETLELANDVISDAGLMQLKDSTNLRELDLTQTRVAGPSLAPFKKLQKLRLWNAPIADDGLKSLAEMSSLIELDLSGTKATEKAVTELRHALPKAAITFR